MKKSFIKLGLLSAFVGLIFSGCGTAQLPPQQIAIAKQTSQVLSVKSVNLSGDSIDKNTILSTVGNQFINGSSYRKKTSYPACNGCQIWNIVGVESKYSNERINLVYTSGEKYSSGKIIEAKDVFNFPVNVEFDTKNGLYKITVDYPDNVITNSAKDGLGATIDQLDNLKNLENDAKRLYANLKNQKVALELAINGEINTKYNDSSTYANFERMLGVYRWNDREKPTNVDIAKEKYFAFKLPDGQSMPLHIKVYPYQNGSKVVYDMPIKYSLDMNGGMSLSKQDMENIKKQISKIAND